jgi:predicted helicase
MLIQFERSKIEEIISALERTPVETIRPNYSIGKDGRDWKLQTAKEDILSGRGTLCKVLYRPFDERFSYYTGKSKGFMAYPRNEVMGNICNQDNLSLIVCKQQSTYDFQHVFITKLISDGNSISIQTKERANAFPLYIIKEEHPQTSIEKEKSRMPNFNRETIDRISSALELEYNEDKSQRVYSNLDPDFEYVEPDFGPEDILDYIYAVLHSPTYREKYKSLLKINFPRIPYPVNNKTFWALVNLGTELRQLHLQESTLTDKYITQYPVNGTNMVETIKYIDGKIWINADQYFDNVPEIAWDFYIGGYQPAQKWLKDRKGRGLNYEEILHYQRIIVTLVETDKLMKAIDAIEI